MYLCFRFWYFWCGFCFFFEVLCFCLAVFFGSLEVASQLFGGGYVTCRPGFVSVYACVLACTA